MARKRRIEREDAIYHIMNRVEEMNHHEEREEHEGRVLRGFGVGFLGPGLVFQCHPTKRWNEAICPLISPGAFVALVLFVVNSRLEPVSAG